ncbi:hypothetical protein BRC2024_KCUCJSVR_CDS_0009 [Acinetobacter phage vB_AbaM_KissB]
MCTSSPVYHTFSNLYSQIFCNFSQIFQFFS